MEPFDQNGNAKNGNTDDNGTPITTNINHPKKKPIDKQKLSLSPIILGRHPSALHLEQGNDKGNDPFNDFEIFQDFGNINITLAPMTDKDDNNEENKSYSLVLNPVEHQVCLESNNFYIKKINCPSVDKNDKKKHKKSEEDGLKVGRRYSKMTPQEEKLDQEITKFLIEGKNYSHIEKKLSKFLKVSNTNTNNGNLTDNKFD